jgi:metal-responsive CopG/Arc/MetJ family transcriptional regulator
MEAMRTHVELSENKIRALRELAARRGFRGYSRILAEAVDEYLERHGRDVAEDRAAKIARLEGSLSDRDAKVMRRVVREIRKERA